MEKIEKTKKKHDHIGTKILKLIIFSCVMLAPFFSILTRCLYVIANPNAKESYYGVVEYLSSSNYKTYIDAKNLQFQSYTDGQYTNYKVSSTAFNNIEIITSINNQNNTSCLYGFNANSVIINGSEYNNIKSFVVGCVGTNWWYIQTYDFVLTDEYYINKIDQFNFDIKYISISMPYINQIRLITSQNILNLSASLTTNVIRSNVQTISDRTVLTYSTFDIFAADNTLSAVFESSLNQIKESDYYNWTQNTGIYNGLNAMCTGLGVNNVIAILLTYWALCTAIYIVFDIVIELFTKLTHFINAD